jgi:hypothetical protein
MGWPKAVSKAHAEIRYVHREEPREGEKAQQIEVAVDRQADEQPAHGDADQHRHEHVGRLASTGLQDVEGLADKVYEPQDGQTGQ